MVRTVVAWGLVAVCVAWVVVRAFGLERGYPMVPLLAFTPLAVGGAVVVAAVAALLRRRAQPPSWRWRRPSRSPSSSLRGRWAGRAAPRAARALGCAC